MAWEREDDPWTGVPLHDGSKTPFDRGAVNPVGAENGVRVYKKIKFVMPLTGRLCGLLSTGCTLVGNAYLQIIAITRLN